MLANQICVLYTCKSCPIVGGLASFQMEDKAMVKLQIPLNYAVIKENVVSESVVALNPYWTGRTYESLPKKGRGGYIISTIGHHSGIIMT